MTFRLAGSTLIISLAALAEKPTFHKDILPVLAERCQTCHRAGEAAPMPLMTYPQVRPWTKAIRKTLR